MAHKYTQEDLAEALSVLEKNYWDPNGNNSKVIGSFDKELEIIHERYIRQSMKRSSFKNVAYENCELENNAFTDSCFYSVSFLKSYLVGNGFSCCNFHKTKFVKNYMQPYQGNAFNQSNFICCKFANVEYKGCGFLQALFNNCIFYKAVFTSCTLEGSKFVNCKFNMVDFGNTNVEFIELTHATLSKIILPFYQFAYIIGIADYENYSTSNISLRIGEREFTMDEYKSQINNLILYYLDKSEYFPVCNLQIFNNNTIAAVETLLDGINKALHDLDFRMIRHYCRLAIHHNLLDEVTTRKISRTIESYITEKDVPPERLNDCIIHAGEIQKILLSGNSYNITLSLNIRTNIRKENLQGIEYVNSLCNRLNAGLSQHDFGQKGFQVAISNHSPFEIAVEVIGTVASIATIAQFIWQIIDNHHSNEKTAGYKMIDQQVYRNYVDNRVELCKEQLLQLKKAYSSKKMNKHINEIIQNLKTDLDELYDSDIMIFKKDNHLE